MNTFHHLEDPKICLKELIRVHSGKNSLIIGDFNETGFIALQKIHQTLYQIDHPRGKFNMKQLKKVLESHYLNVKEINTQLNLIIIASRKKNI